MRIVEKVILFHSYGSDMVGRIKIVRTPSGFPPLWVRQSFVGLILPVLHVFETGKEGSCEKSYIVDREEVLNSLEKNKQRMSYQWHVRMARGNTLTFYEEDCIFCPLSEKG